MRYAWMLVPIAICISEAAHAESWNARINASAGGSCDRGIGSTYTLDLTGDVLTVSNINGKMFATKPASDGKVDQTFKSPSGARLQVVGNAKTRQFQVINDSMGCKWNLEPVK